MSVQEDQEVVICPDCGAEYENTSYCGECGLGQESEPVEAEGVKPEPVYTRRVERRAFPIHEPAWCPHCVAWLGTFPSKDEARAYERSLEDHPFEFCVKRIAKLNGSEEWRLRHEAGKQGSLAASKPATARVPREASA